MKHSRYSLMLRLLLALVALAGLGYWASSTHDQLAVNLHRSVHARSPFVLEQDTRRMTRLEPEARSAGLVEGGRVESLNGAPYTGGKQWDDVTDAARPGDTLLIGFAAPDGSHHRAQLTMAAAQPTAGEPSSKAQVWQIFLLYDLIPLLCMLIGYWVVFVKPDEPNAWLLLLLLLFPAAVFSLPVGLATGNWLVLRLTYYQFLQSFAPMAMLPFAIYFPERYRFDMRAPWLKWVILGPAILAACLDVRQGYGQLFLAGNPAWLLSLLKPADRIENALDLLGVGLYFLILADKLRSAATADTRRRLRVLLAGTSLGIGALLLVYVVLPALGYTPGLRRHLWVYYLGAAVFMLAPLTLAYVVVVQRAMDVRILVRQGTKYALARGTLWALQAGLVAVATWTLLLPVLSNRHAPRYPLAQLALYMALIAGLRFSVRKTSRTWLDRRFFREAYDSEQILSELAEEVRHFTESGPLLQTVARRVCETLHVQPVVMLLRSGADFHLAEASGLPAHAEAAPLLLTAVSSVVRKLSNDRGPAQLYRNDPDAWYMLASKAERDTLDLLEAELLLPLFGRARLMGVMTLGPKQSEAPYTKTDLRLLGALAMQTGMALELGELAHSLAQEAAQRERANHELELAREVQERFFPQEMPLIGAATIAGACRPALGVGGDYYDVFALPDGRLGLVIGDVSGKGISAALLMASLRASMRGVALDFVRDCDRLMQKMNGLVFEASANNRFATLFFAAYDPATRVLECVNAGHNPPLLLRRKSGAGDHEVVRLCADGPVVGLLEGAVYTAQRLHLASGDLLLTYTDGISEAMTHDDQEWGEERLLAAAARVSGSAAHEVLLSVFADADAFTAGAPQHDDMTVLVLKLNEAEV